MKPTLDIDGRRLPEARTIAVQQGITLTRLIEEEVWLRLKARFTSAPLRRVQLPVYEDRHRMAPGIDPLSNKAMLQALEHDV